MKKPSGRCVEYSQNSIASFHLVTKFIDYMYSNPYWPQLFSGDELNQTYFVLCSVVIGYLSIIARSNEVKFVQ